MLSTCSMPGRGVGIGALDLPLMTSQSLTVRLNNFLRYLSFKNIVPSRLHSCEK